MGGKSWSWLALLLLACDGLGGARTGDDAETSAHGAASAGTSAGPPRVTASELPSSLTRRDLEAADLDGLAWPERIRVERALSDRDERYLPRMDETGPVLSSPGSISATFSARGARLALGSHDATLSVVALGRAGAPRVVSFAAPSIVGAEVRSTGAPGVVEWWRALPSGLEHGVTISERPAGEGVLSIEVAVRGDLTPNLVSSDAVELRDVSERTVLTYAHLVVVDADGALVPAHMALGGDRIELVVDDAAARYPLVVDPLVTAEEATLSVPDGAFTDGLGAAVAISDDGNYAIAGAPGDDTPGGTDGGSARVFRRSGTTWSSMATLIPPGNAMDDYFGNAVAITSDGSRALVGASLDNTAAGARAGSAHVFVQVGGVWSWEAMLVAPDGAFNDYFGFAVALSADGSRALVSAFVDDTVGGLDAGSARVFVRAGTSWSQEAMLLAPDGAPDDRFGDSVALSADGSRALVGVASDVVGGVAMGSARVFLRTGSTWTQEAMLVAPDGLSGDALGIAVAFSSDASRALIGAPRDDTAGGVDAGSARVFLRTGTAWAHETALLATGGALDDRAGVSVAMSDDGSLALIGVHQDDTAAGADAGSARIFLRTGVTWAQRANLVAADGVAGDMLGYSVSTTADGVRALVGVPNDAPPAGAPGAGTARVFSAMRTNGEACTVISHCSSGICVDGVCCNEACGGGIGTDCEACSAALTGVASGTCSPLSVAVAPTVTCRADGGACDPGAEVCTNASRACPADVLSPASLECRASAGVCDPAENCTGTSAACPANAFTPASMRCRASAGMCDPAEFCTGSTAACPGNTIHASGYPCRPAAGMCDVGEVCDGASTACPGDAFAAAVTPCRGTAGTCDRVENCTGSTAACPADTFLPNTTGCRAAVGVCDRAETCTGTGPACPSDAFAPSSTLCLAAVAGGCDVAEFCTGTTNTCPLNAVTMGGTVCRSAAGPCDMAETCDGVAATCPANARLPMGTMCRGASGLCDAVETCTGSSNACPADALATSGTTCRAAVALGSGGGCDVAEVCSGTSIACPADLFQAGGAVCRNAGGACGIAETCSGTSAACPVNARLASGTACRASAGPCDPAEVCNGAQDACPGDALSPANTSCRPSVGACDIADECDGASPLCPDALVIAGSVCRVAVAGACDIAETCDGLDGRCPSDAFEPTTTACGSAVLLGPCDEADHCAGSSAACVAAFLSGVVCRDSTDVCDPAESCGGASAGCPADVPAPMGTMCRSSAGDCDPIETCTGLSPSCPADLVAAFGTVCRAAVNPTCDQQEVCDGSTVVCPADVFAPATTPCAPPATEVCDTDDFCSGVSGACVDHVAPAGVECRASAGSCDSPESCSGSGRTCPPDVVEAAGMVCRASIDLSCDPTEACDGLGADCPANVVTCSDAGLGRDATAGGDDAGAPLIAAEGCSCRAAAPRAPSGSAAALVVLLLGSRVRMRRPRD